MFTAACFWSVGFLVGALGIATKQLWLLYLGYGVIGGIGLGIGYISPVSTLIKWFPDRPGMATGLAIMGFGGGALIATPAVPASCSPGTTATTTRRSDVGGQRVGGGELFVTLGIIYFVVMMFGALNIKVPADGWLPEGFDPSTVKAQALVTTPTSPPATRSRPRSSGCSGWCCSAT